VGFHNLKNLDLCTEQNGKLPMLFEIVERDTFMKYFCEEMGRTIKGL